jgi:D-glycero-alpha-D-manno-heptose-7-phosphate kinase
MIIVQTPLRVSFFGGGTDFSDYYLSEGGCVLTSAIDKYIFVTIKKRFDDLIRIGYTRTEMVETVDEVNHELIREALRITGIANGIEVTTMGDIPSAGSGLGSSSTVAVGSLHAMHTLNGKLVEAELLARQACDIEINRLGKPIGIQDQYIAAYGGLRFIEFLPTGEVVVNPVELAESTLRKLNLNLLLFFTGTQRKADGILSEQSKNIQNRLSVLRRLKEMAGIARQELLVGNVDFLGELLHESWELKKQLASKVSNSFIDELYDIARKAGALGGKITGAGGGGFILLYCPYEHQEKLRQALAGSGLQELPFKLEKDGSKVIFNYFRSY